MKASVSSGGRRNTMSPPANSGSDRSTELALNSPPWVRARPITSLTACSTSATSSPTVTSMMRLRSSSGGVTPGVVVAVPPPSLPPLSVRPWPSPCAGTSVGASADDESWSLPEHATAARGNSTTAVRDTRRASGREVMRL